MKLLEIVTEDEAIAALISDYEKKLLVYRFTDEMFKKKYKMTFDEFEDRNIIENKNFSWEVENDSAEWEHALEGIRYIQEKLSMLKDNYA
jgi:hypothetical protein